MPHLMVTVLGMLSDDEETDRVIAGENVKLRLDNVEEEEVSKVGTSICHSKNQIILSQLQ